MEALIQTFHIDPKLMIAQIINFAVVFVILYWFALKPLAKVMRERTETIEKGLKDAEKHEKKLEQTEKEYKSMIAQAKVEAQDIMKQAKEDAEKRREEMMEKAREDVSHVVTQGKNQLAQEKLKMVQEAKEEVIELVSQATRGVLTESVSTEVDEDLIKKQVKELS